MSTKYYDGPVCYVDGWHYTAVPDPEGNGATDDNGNFVIYSVPGEKLVCEDNEDGTESRYRLATEDDEVSWHDRKHGKFTTLEFEDASNPNITVSNEEGAALLKYLTELREGNNE